MYEPRDAPLARPRVFFWRVIGHAVAAAAIVAISLGIGMWGYMHYEHLAWRDAFVNTAMLLGGMGPVNPLTTPGGKVFAGLYALYAGLILLVAVGIITAPVVHRLLHKFHLEHDDGDSRDGGS
jgi:hypothetical protein